MTPRRPPIRRLLALALGVFVVCAGIGVALAALRHHPKHKVVVVSAPPAPTPAARGGAPQPRPPARHATARHAAAPRDRSRGPTTATGELSASFATLSRGLPGRVGLADAPLGAGALTSYGELQSGHAWSTMKVPVLTTLLAGDERSGDVLGSTGEQEAASALEESDNAAAEGLFSELERRDGGLIGASAAVQRTLATAGDSATTVNTAPNRGGFTTWGQSIWANAGEVAFYRSLADGCLLSPENTRYVLGLMRRVVSSQRWGAGSAGYPSQLPLAFKAGWGPEPPTGGYLVRQTAIVGSGHSGYVISMLALPDDGSFTGGIALIDALAKWARAHLPISAAASADC